MKKIVVGVGALVVLVIVGFVLFKDDLIKTAIEQAGSRVTQVSVRLDSVSTSLSENKAALSGLTVGNPSGFKTTEAMSLGLVSVSLAGLPTGSAPIHIKEVMIKTPAITYEGGDKGSNLDVIQRNLSRFSGGGGSSSKNGAAEQKIIIDDLYIKGGQVSVSVLGLAPSTVALPNIHLKDIGKDSGGASPAEVAQKVLAAITSGASSVGGKLAKTLIAGAGKGVDAAKNAAKDAASKAAAGAAGGVGKTMGGATKDIGGAIGGLFGK